MAERIKVNANEIRSSAGRFKNISMNISSILNRCDGTVNMVERSWGGQSRMDFLNRYHELRKQLNELPKIITEFSSYLELAARTMEQQDTSLAKLMGIPLSGVTVHNNGNSIKSWDGKIPSQSNTFDDVVGDARTSGAVSAIDKGIGLQLEKYFGAENTISYNELVENYKKLGYNHDFRRGLLRDIPKECRDIQLEVPEGVKLGKGFGIITSAMLGATAYEDYKNNDTLEHKFEAIGIDATGAIGGYFAINAGVGIATSLATGVAAAFGVAALPEIAVGAVAIGAAAFVGWGVSKGVSLIKGRLGLK